MSDRPFTPAMPRVVFGLILIVLGTLLTLSRLGYDLDAVFEYWPVALIALGLAKLRRAPSAGVFWILAGSLFLVPKLTDRVDFDDLWPLLLVVFGLWVVWRSVGGERRREVAPAATTEDTVRLFAFFGSRKQQVESQAFRGGGATAILGGCELDFYGAWPAGGTAVLEVLAIWGGVTLRMPASWNVTLDVTPVMGGAEDTREPWEAPPTSAPVESLDGEPEPDAEVDRPHLVIKGLALMGGVDVRT